MKKRIQIFAFYQTDLGLEVKSSKKKIYLFRSQIFILIVEIGYY